MTTHNASGVYEVLSPWAEADPVPVRGLTAPRLDTLSGKRIGLFRNDKRAAGPVLTAIEKQFKDRYPDAQISWYTALKTDTSQFEDWLKGVDAVVAAVGD